MSEQHQKTVFDSSVANAATATIDIPVGVAEALVIAWTMTNALAAGDIGTPTVKMFRPGSATPLPNALIPTVYATASAAGDLPVSSKVETYDVRGMNKVRLSVLNGTGTARTVKIHVYTYSSTG